MDAFAIERCKESNQICLSVLSNVTFHPGLVKSRDFAIPDPSAFLYGGLEFVSRHPDLRNECRRECIVLDSFHLIRQHFI